MLSPEDRERARKFYGLYAQIILAHCGKTEQEISDNTGISVMQIRHKLAGKGLSSKFEHLLLCLLKSAFDQIDSESKREIVQDGISAFRNLEKETNYFLLDFIYPNSNSTGKDIADKAIVETAEKHHIDMLHGGFYDDGTMFKRVRTKLTQGRIRDIFTIEDKNIMVSVYFHPNQIKAYDCDSAGYKQIKVNKYFDDRLGQGVGT